MITFTIRNKYMPYARTVLRDSKISYQLAGANADEAIQTVQIMDKLDPQGAFNLAIMLAHALATSEVMIQINPKP